MKIKKFNESEQTFVKTMPFEMFYLPLSELQNFINVNGGSHRDISKEFQITDDGSGVLGVWSQGELNNTEEHLMNDYGNETVWVKRFYETHNLTNKDIAVVQDY